LTAATGVVDAPKKVREMADFVLLLRGVNVGKGNRVPMAELRAILTELGYHAVTTLLNSGNAVFATHHDAAPERLATDIGIAIADRLGVTPRVIVQSASSFSAIVDGCPISVPESDHAKLLVAFASEPADLAALSPLLTLATPPERFVITPHAAYWYAPAGILASPVGDALLGRVGQRVTTRNWGTVLKITRELSRVQGQA
jgi:uncharacterized protein (DUF1697 family)